MSIHAHIAANDRLTYAQAAMQVAAERGPRPIVRVPVRHSYSGLSNEARYEEATRMFDGITAREEWDRAVTRAMEGAGA